MRQDKHRYEVFEFATVKVQGIFVTCVHLPNLGEQVRITDLKRIWGEQEKKGLWKEVGAKHIFAGDFNSLTWEDEDEEGWMRVGKEMAADNMKLDELISLSKRKQRLEKDSNSQNLGAKVPWCHGAKVPWCHGAMTRTKRRIGKEVLELRNVRWTGRSSLKRLQLSLPTPFKLSALKIGEIQANSGSSWSSRSLRSPSLT